MKNLLYAFLAALILAALVLLGDYLTQIVPVAEFKDSADPQECIIDQRTTKELTLYGLKVTAEARLLNLRGADNVKVKLSCHSAGFGALLFWRQAATMETPLNAGETVVIDVYAIDSESQTYYQVGRYTEPSRYWARPAELRNGPLEIKITGKHVDPRTFSFSIAADGSPLPIEPVLE